MELYKRIRPKKLSDVLGQSAALLSLEKLVSKGKIPHALLLSGPSGVGKTTIARILKTHVKCQDSEFHERNCADLRGIDDVRRINETLTYRPMGGGSRLWLIDEAHKLTGDAQEALLKMLEDTPDWIYFVLCTTNPDRLIKTIRTRCTHIKLESLKANFLYTILRDSAKKEGFKLSDDVFDAIVEAAGGSARQALVILEQVGELDHEKDQLAAVNKNSADKEEAVVLARKLLNFASWSEVAETLKAIQDQDAEGLRRMILGYMLKCLLSSPKLAGRGYLIIDVLAKNVYDSGHAGLAAGCYEICRQK